MILKRFSETCVHSLILHRIASLCIALGDHTGDPKQGESCLKCAAEGSRGRAAPHAVLGVGFKKGGLKGRKRASNIGATPYFHRTRSDEASRVYRRRVPRFLRRSLPRLIPRAH